MSEKIYQVPAEWQRAHLDDAKYQEMYARSIEDPNGFWAEQAQRVDWYRTPSKVKNTSFAPDNVSIKWFEDGVAQRRLQLHRPPSAASAPSRPRSSGKATTRKDDKHITYRELHDEVCRFANVLRNRNVEKGDRVTIYMPMIPEAAYAMLACARIGAIHSVVFGGFSPDSLAGRIEDCELERRHHGGRGPARRPQGPAQGQRRRGARQGRRRRPRDRGAAAPARKVDDGAGARRLVPRGRRGGDERVPVRADERRGPAVHPLHLGLDRKAEGRAAHHRRLPGLRRDDAPIRVRLSRRRHLLVHRRRRLGDRATATSSTARSRTARPR